METNNQNPAGINTPDLDSSMAAHTPALTSIDQAVELVKSLDSENRERSTKNSRILSKYNSERPYEPQRLRDEGLSWRSNFSTKPLANLVDKVVPRFVTGIENMKFLTASKLPDSVPGAAAKTESFRRGITELCRSRAGWKDFVTEVAQENTLFGYCAVGWTTRYEWMPRCFTQDNFLVPQGTKHTAKTSQIVAFRETFLIHELFHLISDRQSAELSGWNVDNCIHALNAAKPDDRRSGFSDVSRIYADMQREANVATSYLGAKVVSVWHVFVSELDGRVTHVAFDAASNKELFWKDKQFDSMADVAAFFSFQHGNGKVHSSKGIGRELYALAGVLDRSRNEVVDRLILSGKLIINCDEKQIKRFRMSVVGCAILIDEQYKIAQQKIDAGVESYFSLDQFLTGIIDEVAGSTSPQALSGERVTRAAVELNAGREEEKRDSLIERFLSQFATMMSTVQRRACDPKCVDDDAKEFQQKMLSVMTPEELAYLAKQPAVSIVRDYTDEQRQLIVGVAQEARGNPLYNQRAIEHRKLTAILDSEFADSVLMSENDPTEQVEQTRQQQTELILLQQGQQVPVSPRDNHVVHISMIREAVAGMLEAASQDPTTWPMLANLAGHAEEHVAAAEQAGQAQQVAELKSFVASLKATLLKLSEHEQQAAAEGHPEAGLPAGEAQTAATPSVEAPAETASPVAAPLPDGVTPEQYGRDLTNLYKSAPDEIKRQIEAYFKLEPAMNPTPTAPAPRPTPTGSPE